MTGLDIIEAMQNIDERLILDAKRHKKNAPPLLRYISLAAIVCCVLFLSLLAINRIITPGEENIPDTLAPTEESTRDSAELPPETDETVTTSIWEEENTVLLSSARYPVTMRVPEEYSKNVLVDTPFSCVAHTNTPIEYDNVAFSFYDHPLPESDMPGMVFLIIATPIEEFDFERYERYEGINWMFSNTVIGTDEEYVYEIIHPGYPEEFYNNFTLEDTTTYLNHLYVGYEILEEFASENNLEVNSDWGEHFTNLTISPVETRAASFDGMATPAIFGYTLSSYSTACTTEENRTTNMELACSAIDGTEIQPGETFSFNDALGERTVEKGYQEAPVYTTADSEPAIGGGISQVASTLYACCLYADLEIMERQGHIFYESYLPGGMDAAVYWDSTDFKFRNNTDSAIRIRAYFNEGSLWVELQSPQNPQFTADITMDYSTTDTEMIYRLTRHIYDLDGNLIRTDTTGTLDAMGGLGTTVYTIQNVATEAEEAAVPITETSKDVYPLQHTDTDAVLNIPLSCKDSFATYSDYTYTSDVTDETFSFSRGIYWFFDTIQEQHGYTGLVWIITKYSMEELDSFVRDDASFGDLCFTINNHILGIKNDEVFVLCNFGPGTPMTDGTYRGYQYDASNKECVASYLSHMETGLAVLEDFIHTNKLTVPEGVTDWREWYMVNVLTPIQELA